MEVSLEQAIEIHAKALKGTHGKWAPVKARARAAQLAASGDHEGHTVWQRVAEAANAMLHEETLNAPKTEA
jgi:hypothetical protein